MVSKRAAHSPSGEKLPAGWAVKFHVSKSGTRFKYYENSIIGQKFFSKDDITRYIEMFDDLQPTKGPIWRVAENSKMHITEKATNEDLEWLPHGWIMQGRTRKSGPKCGRIYKIYVEQSSGRKFDSKVGVLRYLNTVKQESCTSEQKIEPATKHATNKVVNETSTVEDLPPGWIKEFKIRKFKGRAKKDPYYTDTETGYVFRSKREVQRYLETREIRRHQKKHINDETMHLASARCKPSTFVVNRQHPYTVKGRYNLRGRGYNLRGRGMPIVANTSIKLRGKNVTSETKQPVNPAFKKFPKKCPPDNMVNNIVDETEIIAEQSVEKKKETRSNRKSQSTSCNSDEKKGFILPRRSSKRLAGPEPEQAANPFPINRAVQDGKKYPKVTTAMFRAEDLSLGLKKEHNIRTYEGHIRKDPSASAKCEQLMSYVTGQQFYTDTHIDARMGRYSERGSTIPAIAATSKKRRGKSLFTESEIPAEKLQQDGVINGGSESKAALDEHIIESDKEKNNNGNSKKGSCISDDKIGLTKPSWYSKQLAGFDPRQVGNSISDSLGGKPLKEFLEGARTRQGKPKSTESSSKCNIANEHNLQQRSSKRLADLKQKLVDNSEPRAQVTKSNFNARESERHQMVSLIRSSDSKAANSNDEIHVEMSDKSQLSLAGESVPKEQQEEVRADGTDNEILKVLLTPKITEFCTDPCIDFAFKTLTGAITIENFMDSQVVSAPAAYSGNEILHRSRSEESSKKETLDHSSQYNASRKTVLALQCSRQLFESETISKVSLGRKTVAKRSSQPFKAGFVEFANRKPFNISAISSILPQNLEVQNTDIKEPAPKSFLSFGDCWSDPSVEYALETPTGAIPLKGELSTLHFQQQGASKDQNHDSLPLPDFCFPSSFQNDFSLHFNAPKEHPSQKQEISQQVTSLLPSTNTSVPPFIVLNRKDFQSKGKKGSRTSKS